MSLIDERNIYIVHHGTIVVTACTTITEAETALKEANDLGPLKYGITRGIGDFAKVVAEEVRKDTAKYLGYD